MLSTWAKTTVLIRDEQLQTLCAVSEDDMILCGRKSWSPSPDRRGGREGRFSASVTSGGWLKSGAVTFLCLMVLHLLGEEEELARAAKGRAWGRDWVFGTKLK